MRALDFDGPSSATLEPAGLPEAPCGKLVEAEGRLCSALEVISRLPPDSRLHASTAALPLD